MEIMLIFKGFKDDYYISHKGVILKGDSNSIIKVEKADVDIFLMTRMEVFAVAILRTKESFELCVENNDTVKSIKLRQADEKQYVTIKQVFNNLSIKSVNVSKEGYEHIVYLFHMNREKDVSEFVSNIKEVLA